MNDNRLHTEVEVGSEIFVQKLDDSTKMVTNVEEMRTETVVLNVYIKCKAILRHGGSYRRIHVNWKCYELSKKFALIQRL